MSIISSVIFDGIYLKHKASKFPHLSPICLPELIDSISTRRLHHRSIGAEFTNFYNLAKRAAHPEERKDHNFYNLTKCAARPGGRGKQTDVGLSERR